MARFAALAALAAFALASPLEHHDEHDHYHGEQLPLGYVKYPAQFSDKYFFRSGASIERGAEAWMPGDGETTADSIFAGIGTFAHLPYGNCFSTSESFDIAFLGAPFDTGTSYRPGARFGPAGIRQGSRRLTLYGGYSPWLDVNPFRSWAKLVDCGDVHATSYDNTVAIAQIEKGHKELLHRTPATEVHERDPATGALKPARGFGKDGKVHPRIITFGGDHTIVLPLLRSIKSAYGPVSVIHFDSHLDTWKPSVFGGAPSEVASINHGTYFWHASQEGLIRNGTSVHSGIRTTLSGPSDYVNDAECGFHLIEARDIDKIGTAGIIKRIRETCATVTCSCGIMLIVPFSVGDSLVYLSLDIDVLDPSAAPATGTPETGGWSTRELRTILRGLEGLNIISADIVEVAPPYDTAAELTQQAAADVVYEMISLMVKAGPLVAK